MINIQQHDKWNCNRFNSREATVPAQSIQYLANVYTIEFNTPKFFLVDKSEQIVVFVFISVHAANQLELESSRKKMFCIEFIFFNIFRTAF